MNLLRTINVFSKDAKRIRPCVIEVNSDKLCIFFDTINEDFGDYLQDVEGIGKSWPKELRQEMIEDILANLLCEKLDTTLTLAIDELQCGEEALTVAELLTLPDLGIEEIVMESVCQKELNFTKMLTKQIIKHVNEGSDEINYQLYLQFLKKEAK